MYYLFAANSARNPDGQNGARMNYFQSVGKAGFWMARAASGAYACGFLGSEGRRTQFELALVKEEGVPGRGEARIMDHGVRLWSGPRARDVFGSGRTKRPGHIVLLTQNPCRHVSRTGAHRGELKAPPGIFIERDAAGGNLIDGA